MAKYKSNSAGGWRGEGGGPVDRLEREQLGLVGQREVFKHARPQDQVGGRPQQLDRYTIYDILNIIYSISFQGGLETSLGLSPRGGSALDQGQYIEFHFDYLWKRASIVELTLKEMIVSRGKLDIPEVTHNDEVVEEEESRDVVSALHVDADMLIF